MYPRDGCTHGVGECTRRKNAQDQRLWNSGCAHVCVLECVCVCVCVCGVCVLCVSLQRRTKV